MAFGLGSGVVVGSGVWEGSGAVLEITAPPDRLSAGAEGAVSLCGFVGRNSGEIRNSYAAMDLRAGGAGCEVHGFCDPDHDTGSQSDVCFLDRGDFLYRGVHFLADSGSGPNGSRSCSYEELTAPGAVPGMSDSPAGQDFPYPTGVTDGEGQPVHYGLWPAPMEPGRSLSGSAGTENAGL